MQMKCPNCGSPYDPEEILCPKCGQPLSNATYTPVKPGEKKPKRRRWRRILLIIILVIAAAVIVYRIYIYEVKKQCKNVVSLIFDTAAGMDFDTAVSENLPDFLQNSSAAQDFIEDQFDTFLAPYHLDGFSDFFSDMPDGFTDMFDGNFSEILSAITESADYAITDVTADYHSCTVYVRTENTDFLSLASNVAEGVTGELEEIRESREREAQAHEAEENAAGRRQEDASSDNQDTSLWDRVRNAFSSLFHPADGGESAGDDKTTGSTEETALNDTDFLTDIFDPILEEARENTGTVTAEGTFVFGIRDRKWTLISVDNELFYCFYGISLPSGS